MFNYRITSPGDRFIDLVGDLRDGRCQSIGQGGEREESDRAPY